MTRVRSYSELRRFHTFPDRFEYLKLGGSVGRPTFGSERYINQRFYTSFEWKSVRDTVIVRDNGCDLGIDGHEIHEEILIHHVNPMCVDDIVNGEQWILDPEYLITTTVRTHNAIHYGHILQVPEVVMERKPGDTKLW